MRQVLFQRQVQSRRRGGLEVRIAGRDIAAARIDGGGGGYLLEAGSRKLPPVRSNWN